MNSIIEKAKYFIEQDNFKDALILLQSLPDENNVDRSSLLGIIYQCGIDGQRDIYKAVEFLTIAADGGNAIAAHNLGTLYLTCEPDLPVDKNKSNDWYRIAQELGFLGGKKDWFKNN